MRKFSAAALLILCLLGSSGRAEAGVPDPNLWQSFQATFVRPSGRVVDKKEGAISHSEGQGFALLFATAFDDKTAFARIWRWTHENLQVRNDALLAWKWVPNAANPVPDKNDAADGDIFTAWALARAGEEFHEPKYTAEARRIAVDIRRELIRTEAGRPILLPGSEGFVSDKGAVINLSYWIFPAFATLNRLDPSPEWAVVEKSGLALIDQAQFGQWKLPPDWLGISPQGKLFLPADRPQRFSYDAIRIPLYLIWAGLETPDRLKPYLHFWDEYAKVPFVGAWTNLNDNSIASYGLPGGFKAVRNLVVATSEKRAYHSIRIDAKDGYYSSALIILADLAAGGRQKR